MDALDLFFKKFSYKFEKGYPDMNNKQDILLLESVLQELGINLILENDELISTLNKSGNFSEFGEISSSGKKTIELTFSNVPSTGAQSKQQRQEIYDLIKQMSDKGGDISNFKKLPTGSSIGSAEITFKGKPLKIVIKGTPGESSSDTDVKEALVSLFYTTNIDSPFNQENYNSRIESLIEISSKGISGESSGASEKVTTFLTAIAEKNTSANINFINQPLSSALAIKEKYPNQKLIRTGIFNTIRNKASQLTGLPADKWCPGDVYVQLEEIKDIEQIDNIEILNRYFNDEWGSKEKSLVAVSLKQEVAQGGKAKALLNKYTKVKNDYNLTNDEINFKEEQYKQGINRLRNNIQSLVKGNENIVYDLQSGELKNEIGFLRGKYAALKSIEFLFKQFPTGKVDEAIVALVGFALSLSGVNPTFFKITGQRSGVPGKVDKFPKGEGVVLYNVNGDYEPIKIIDSPSFGGLKMDFKIEKGGKPYSVSINARNNGNVQGTLEIQKISPAS
jgi:hypothetical protein